MEKEYNDDYNKDFDTYKKANAAVSLGGFIIGGIGMGIAKRNQKKAEQIYGPSYEKYMISLRIFEENSQKAKETITDLVRLKKQIMSTHIKSYLKALRRLNSNIDLIKNQTDRDLQLFINQDFTELNRLVNAYQKFDEQELGNDISNIALLMVQDGTISNLAYTMKDVIQAGKIKDDELKRNSIDNLKIQSIDIIAQFSTAAIEFGLSGISDAFSSGKRVNQAKIFAAKCEENKERIDIQNLKNIAINNYAVQHLKLLQKLVPLMEEYVGLSIQIIKNKDNIFHFGQIKIDKFTKEEFDLLSWTSTLVQTAKVVIDAPIISQNGDVYNEIPFDFTSAQNDIEVFERHRLEMKG